MGSWPLNIRIDEFRPWPDAVEVARGTHDDTRRYVPEGERDMYRDLVDCMVHPDIPDQLQAENDKLRELVRELYETAYPEYPSMFEKLFSERIRELGIEVDV